MRLDDIALIGHGLGLYPTCRTKSHTSCTTASRKKTTHAPWYKTESNKSAHCSISVKPGARHEAIPPSCMRRSRSDFCDLSPLSSFFSIRCREPTSTCFHLRMPSSFHCVVFLKLFRSILFVNVHPLFTAISQLGPGTCSVQDEFFELFRL